MRAGVALATLSVACFDRITFETQPTREPPSCEVTVTRTVPADGATDVYWRDVFEFHLSEAAPEARVLFDLPGRQSTRDDGRVIVFTPAEALLPDTDYTLGLDYCHGTPEIAFRTSSLGQPLAQSVDLVGATFAISLDDAAFTAGSGVGDLLAGLFGRDLLVQMLEDHGDSLDVRVGVAAAGTDAQDECYRTLDVSGVDFEDAPFFSFARDAVVFDAFTAEMSLEELAIDGTISSDGAEMGGIRLDLTVDARDLATALGAESSADVCDLAATLGVACETCPSDGKPECLALGAEDLYGERVNAVVTPAEGCE